MLLYSVMMVPCLRSVMGRGEFSSNLFSACETFDSETTHLSNLTCLILSKAFQHAYNI